MPEQVLVRGPEQELLLLSLALLVLCQHSSRLILRGLIDGIVHRLTALNLQDDRDHEVHLE